MRRNFRWIAALPLALAFACGETPDQTQKARGVLKGVNLIAGMTVAVIVLTIAIIVGAVAIDRFVRSRNRLAVAAPEPEAPEEDEVVAGITVGRAGVPRWLYAFYVLIPVFALAYVFSNVSVQSTAEKKAAATAKPSGPVTQADVVASGIKFDVSELTLKANSQITIDIDNKDTGIPHTFTVWKSASDAASGASSGKIADTGTFTGGTKKTLTFKTDGPVEWYFDCTVHPTMKGTIKVV